VTRGGRTEKGQGGRGEGRELNRRDWIARRQSGLSQRRLGNCDNVIRLISDKGAVRVAEFIVEPGIEILRRAQSSRVCRELRCNEIWLAKSWRGICFRCVLYRAWKLTASYMYELIFARYSMNLLVFAATTSRKLWKRSACFARIFAVFYSFTDTPWMLPKLRGIIFHSFAETAKRHFSMNSNPIHPRYAHVECSLLHELPSRIFTCILDYIRGIVSIPSTFISRNPIELLNSRIVSHFDETKKTHIYTFAW